MKQCNGGKVINSGGFGCVFKPALKCKNKNISSNELSKLMLTENAEEEIDEINEFKNILKKIPQYSEFFLVEGFDICIPEKLTQNDLEKFDEKCSALKKKGLNSSNINLKLNNLLAINMPNGGVNINEYLEKHFSSQSLSKLHISLIGLLEKGILPMNKKDLYHCDIKSSNVLVKIENKNEKMLTRLIDWGLSTHYTNKSQIPNNLYKRPFQFNVPFSVILFTNEFQSQYNLFLKNHINPSYYEIREFSVNYIYNWIKIRGLGHLKVINKKISNLHNKELTKSIHDKNLILKYDFTYYYIIEYISNIIFHFTKNNQFHMENYFNNVFIKNIDIWGFITIYYSFMDLLNNHYDELNNVDLVLFSKLKYLIIHFLFENPEKPILTNDLLSYLKNITPLFQQSTIFSSSISQDSEASVYPLENKAKSFLSRLLTKK